MANILLDFSKKIGAIKPMNAGNNGPKIPRGDQTSGNFDTFKMLGIPYARVHDANFSLEYGGPFTVDFWAIFPNWNADPDDPKSYDFLMTDVYLQSIEKAGTEPFFRLGGMIEHGPKKHFTRVPPDFRKFAVVCEHIVRHCTGDWANGLNMKITYWEIWNEPDLDGDDSPNKRNWQGTAEQFYEMFVVAYKHLKAAFPHLKFGGPAACAAINNGRGDHWTDRFFAALEKNCVALDFYSWHCYTCEPSVIADTCRTVRDYLDSHGQKQAESVLNEWNYVKGWSDAWVYSLEQEGGMKGAAFALSTMLACQKQPLDMLMYYDMRVSCGMNGLWDPITFDRRKSWYSYFMFEKLASLGTEVESSTDEPKQIFVLGATSAKGSRVAAIVSCFKDDDNFSVHKPSIRILGLTAVQKENLSVRLLDAKLDCVEVPFDFDGETMTFPFNVDHNAGLLIQA